jgi:hypothetical protein
MASRNDETEVATSTTKPAANRRKGRKASVVSAPKLGLVTNTGRLTGLRADINEMLEVFELMNDRSTRRILGMAKIFAENWPRRAELRLIGAQLEHQGFKVSRLNGDVTVLVKGPGQMFSLTLERALHRIDEFKAPDQARILSALPHCYDIPGGDRPSAGHIVCVSDRSLVDTPRSRPGRKTSNRAAAPRAKKSKPAATESA